MNGKTIVVWILSLLCGSDCILAQPRHIQGMDMVDLSLGTGLSSRIIQLGYQHYQNDACSVRASVQLNEISRQLESATALYMGPELAIQLFHNNRTLFTEALFGMEGGIEQVTGRAFQKTNDSPGLFLGLGLGMDYYFTGNWKIRAEVSQEYFLCSILEQARLIFTLGIAFTLK